MRRRALLIVAALALGGSASANKLPVKTIDMVTLEIIDDVATGMSKGGGGQVVRKSVPKIPGKIPWGGVISFAPFIIQSALQYLFDEMKRDSGVPALDNWYRNGTGGYPEPKTITAPDGYVFSPTGEACSGTNDSGVRYTYWIARTTLNGGSWFNVYYSYYLSNGSRYDGNAGSGSYEQVKPSFDTSCSALRQGETLDQLFDRVPEARQAVRDAVTDFIQVRPDAMKPYFGPGPNVNQWNDELIDPFIVSVPGGRYSDGDYLQEGIEPTPGHRGHPGDGGALEPWIDSPTPVDTDGDGVPDWRDSDDDGDGFSDEEEDPNWQKEKEKTPVTEKDTDGDGVPDHTDPDDDQDGWSDEQEEGEGTNPKDRMSTPTDSDRDGTPDSKDRDDDGDGWDDTTEVEKGTNPKDPTSSPPDEDKDGVPDDEEEEEEEEEPTPCADGEVAGADGECVPEDPTGDLEEKKEACEAAGREWDSINDECGAEKKEDPKPVADECGDFTIPRLLQHTGSYLRDVVFPCDDIDWSQFSKMIENKFPFSVVRSMSSFVAADSSNSTNPLPTQIGPFTLSFDFAQSFFVFMKMAFRVVLWFFFFRWLLDRLSGQVVLS